MAAIEPGDGHDLASRLNTPMNQVCVPCHTPHAAPYYTDGPLWNHQPTTGDPFTGHDGPLTLSGSSRLCMGCHDGVTALSNYGGVESNSDALGAVPSNIGWAPGAASNARILADDHPVSVPYEGHLADETTTIFARNQPIENFLEDGNVECATCHSAHSASPERGLASSGRGAYLIVTIENSELCRKCHLF